MTSAKSNIEGEPPSVTDCVSHVRVAAVVVTCNRLSLLQRNIDALKAQTRPVDTIIVVDNGCTDGTAQWLHQQHGVVTLTQSNQGSSGGQFTGIRTAYQYGCDWFWCMDDDTIPEPDSLAELMGNSKFHDPQTGFLASMVLWVDGAPHKMNTPTLCNQATWLHTVLDSACIPVQSASFVSLLVSRRAVAAIGLPIHDMFIWYDDVEFTQRISNRFQAFLCLRSLVSHVTHSNSGPSDFTHIEPKDAWKHCYGTRNHVYILRHSKGSAFLRARRIVWLVAFQAKRVLRRRAPLKILWWTLKGLWYRPTIEFPEPVDAT